MIGEVMVLIRINGGSVKFNKKPFAQINSPSYFYVSPKKKEV